MAATTIQYYYERTTSSESISATLHADGDIEARLTSSASKMARRKSLYIRNMPARTCSAVCPSACHKGFKIIVTVTVPCAAV